MTNGQRAKIFAPYAALKGFGNFILGAEERGDEQKAVLVRETPSAAGNA